MQDHRSRGTPRGKVSPPWDMNKDRGAGCGGDGSANAIGGATSRVAGSEDAPEVARDGAALGGHGGRAAPYGGGHEDPAREAASGRPGGRRKRCPNTPCPLDQRLGGRAHRRFREPTRQRHARRIPHAHASGAVQQGGRTCGARRARPNPHQLQDTEAAVGAGQGRCRALASASEPPDAAVKVPRARPSSGPPRRRPRRRPWPA